MKATADHGRWRRTLPAQGSDRGFGALHLSVHVHWCPPVTTITPNFTPVRARIAHGRSVCMAESFPVRLSQQVRAHRSARRRSAPLHAPIGRDRTTHAALGPQSLQGTPPERCIQRGTVLRSAGIHNYRHQQLQATEPGVRSAGEAQWLFRERLGSLARNRGSLPRPACRLHEPIRACPPGCRW